jgi:non-heme chloroperoxidase
MRLLVVAMCLGLSAAQAQSPPVEPSAPPPAVRFVTVDKDVTLEVLDWGGTGRPLIFLAGLGGTAHTFEALAPKFAGAHHVYAITRRGYGASSKPEPVYRNYMADRLGDDVLAVIDALKLDRPVVAGHSIAGEELSSIGSRHPEKVAGLIYLDAHGAHAFYDPGQDNYAVDGAELFRRLDQLKQPTTLEADKARMEELLQSGLLRQYETDIRLRLSVFKALPALPQGNPRPDPDAPYNNAIFVGQQRYTHVDGPILAIMALPQDSDKDVPPSRKAAQTMNLRNAMHRAAAFQAAMPQAHVVRLAYANHFVFRSNETDVLREMSAFLAMLD